MTLESGHFDFQKEHQFQRKNFVPEISMPFLTVALALVLGLVTTQSAAEEDLAALHRRKADLESQLKALNERIASVESNPTASSVSPAAPRYFCWQNAEIGPGP